MKDFAIKLKDNNGILDWDRIRKVIEKAIDNYGKELSMVIVTEELSELQKEISKQARNIGEYYNLLEEMADVVISIEFIKHAFHLSGAFINEAINTRIKYKSMEEFINNITMMPLTIDTVALNDEIMQVMDNNAVHIALINNNLLAELQHGVVGCTFEENDLYDISYAIAGVIICIETLKIQYNITTDQLNQGINTKISRLEEIHYKE